MSQRMETATTTKEPVLSIERVFKAPRSAVWAAWTKAEGLSAWMGPDGITCGNVSVDARVGGKYSMQLTGASGSKNTCVGEYLEMVEPERLVFSFSWLQDDGNPGQRMLITLDFEDLGDETRMRFFQQSFIDTEARDQHNEGWTGSFTKLARLLETEA